MSSKFGYCIWCGEEVYISSYEAHTCHILWERCKCFKGKKHEVKTTQDGFVIEPEFMRGKYIYTRRQFSEIPKRSY